MKLNRSTKRRTKRCALPLDTQDVVDASLRRMEALAALLSTFADEEPSEYRDCVTVAEAACIILEEAIRMREALKLRRARKH